MGFLEGVGEEMTEKRLEGSMYKPWNTKDSWLPPEARQEAWNRFAFRTNNPADNLIPESQPPELRENTRQLF